MSDFDRYPRYRFETWQEYEARRARKLCYCCAMTILCGIVSLILLFAGRVP